MYFLSLQVSPYISYHKLPKPHSIAAPPRRPPPLLCLQMKNLPTSSDGSVCAPPNQRLRSVITTASGSTDSKTTNLSSCGDTEKGISRFTLKFDANANNDAVDSYPHLPPQQTHGEFECLMQPDAYSADNIDVWKSKLDTLLHDKDKQELVSREKKDRRDYEQIAALASRMDLYSHLYVKAVVVSKVPLPSYRFDLDDKRPQREVFLSPRLQKRVQAHLLNYISEKPTSRGMFSGSSSNATIVTDDLFENPEPFPHSRPNDENILWRKSLQMRDKQRTWQESTEGREILEFRRNLPAFKEKDTILSAISQNQVVIISGETGCGKTTQIPQFILESEIESLRGAMCNILCTQPRRLSVMSVSERIATERMEKLGETVGFKVRLEGIKGRDTHLLFCTTGILLRRLLVDKNLKDVTHVIVDEIHERGINEDFLLVVLKDLLLLRPQLRLILMSATLDADLFSSYFSGAPVVHISSIFCDMVSESISGQ